MISEIIATYKVYREYNYHDKDNINNSISLLWLFITTFCIEIFFGLVWFLCLVAYQPTWVNAKTILVQEQ